ncbi:hypothetical protein ASF82_13490 [Frigoribacterium sp. Leaf164]|uniref:hypothetical protein n=1 Tax=Frigoribacterium sp. Leaf164 TaxID=1736282 RepID=UPI0006F56169|nr:hypothetical protein [Frigoribacterium sp. Leaf164]KQR44448.1 hypothetical protein ASF82_13490 [Frigoribacterium sp. Leaf164]
MTDQPAPRPPSPWARFARPAPGEQRPRAEVQPPPARQGAPWPGGADQAWAGQPFPQQQQYAQPFPQPAVTTPAAQWAPQAAPPQAAAPQASSAQDALTWPAPAAPGVGSYFAVGDDEWPPPPRPRDGADEGRGLAVASVVFGVFAAPLGLVFGLVAARRAAAAGASAALARVGLVVSSVMIVVGLVAGVSALDYAARLSSTCAQLGPGEYLDDQGRGVTCD